jgi:uncharacterized protein YlxP (DUF503 family)
MEIRRGVVGIARIDFRVIGSRSLKEKRSTVKSFLGQIRSRHPVSAAETGYQEDHQRASVTVAVVSARAHGAGEVLRSVVDHLEDRFPVEVFHVEEEISEGE